MGYNTGNVKGNEVFRMKRYRKRIADDILKRKLEGKGAVLIEGPKWCGKTTTAEQLAASILYMDDPEKKEQNIAMSELNPKRLLKGATPRLIDEWQLAPKLWDAIRFEVDHRGELVRADGDLTEGIVALGIGGFLVDPRSCALGSHHGDLAVAGRGVDHMGKLPEDVLFLQRFDERALVFIRREIAAL